MPDIRMSLGRPPDYKFGHTRQRQMSFKCPLDVGVLPGKDLKTNRQMKLKTLMTYRNVVQNRKELYLSHRNHIISNWRVLK